MMTNTKEYHQAFDRARTLCKTNAPWTQVFATLVNDGWNPTVSNDVANDWFKLLLGKKCVATPEAPFTDEQRCRLGTILDTGNSSIHVEWEDRTGWKTRAWVPISWVHIDP